jgi:hypothetical protein
VRAALPVYCWGHNLMQISVTTPICDRHGPATSVVEKSAEIKMIEIGNNSALKVPLPNVIIILTQ